MWHIATGMQTGITCWGRTTVTWGCDIPIEKSPPQMNERSQLRISLNSICGRKPTQSIAVIITNQWHESHDTFFATMAKKKQFRPKGKAKKNSSNRHNGSQTPFSSPSSLSSPSPSSRLCALFLSSSFCLHLWVIDWADFFTFYVFISAAIVHQWHRTPSLSLIHQWRVKSKAHQVRGRENLQNRDQLQHGNILSLSFFCFLTDRC